MHSHGQLRRMRAKWDPSSCFPLSRVSFLFSLSLSFSPDFPLLCMAPSVTPRPVNQHLEGEEDFLQWARNEARQGQKGKCAFPPPPPRLLALSSLGCRPLCAHFLGRPKSQRGGTTRLRSIWRHLLRLVLWSPPLTTLHDCSPPLYFLSPSPQPRGEEKEWRKNNDDAPPTTSRNFANHSITDSQTEYNYSALLAVSGTMQARKRRCT